MASSSSHQMAQGPPYPPKTWSLGATPSPIPDVPIDAVFLALFFVLGGTSMRIFIMNRMRGHWFIFNAVVFGLSMTRVIANALRIASAYQPHNVRLAIASSIFVAAGVVVLFVMNNFFALRIFRARHPRLGWSKVPTFYPIAVIVMIVLHIILIITVVICSFYTLSEHLHDVYRSLMTYTAIVFAVMAFLPIPVILLALAIPLNGRKPDHFGAGKLSTKIALVLVTSSLLTLGAAFRAGTDALPPTPITETKPWYLSKACFYCFNFTVEIISASLMVYSRMDRLFHVPNEAKHTGTYSLEAARAWREEHSDRNEKGATSGDEDDEQAANVAKIKSVTHNQKELREVDSDMTLGRAG